MGRPASEDGPGHGLRCDVDRNEPKVSRNNIQVEHIRIDSEKSYDGRPNSAGEASEIRRSISFSSA